MKTGEGVGVRVTSRVTTISAGVVDGVAVAVADGVGEGAPEGTTADAVGETWGMAGITSVSVGDGVAVCVAPGSHPNSIAPKTNENASTRHSLLPPMCPSFQRRPTPASSVQQPRRGSQGPPFRVETVSTYSRETGKRKALVMKQELATGHFVQVARVLWVCRTG